MRLRKVLANNLRHIMEERDLSQTDLAKITKVGQTHISSILRCTKSASTDKIEQLADGLKVPPYAFYANLETFKTLCKLSAAGLDKFEIVVRP